MKLASRMIALTLTMLPLLGAAQMSSGDKIVSNVPFEFVLGNKIIPAGQCSVQMKNSGMVLAIVNDKVGQLFSSFLLDETKQASGRYELVFHRYGDRTFLSAIRVGGSSTVYRLPESKAEAELQAQNATSTEQTLVASRR